MQLFFSLFIFLTLPLPVWSQQPKAHFDQLTTAGGLLENSAFAMLQDRLGYLWLGT